MSSPLFMFYGTLTAHASSSFVGSTTTDELVATGQHYLNTNPAYWDNEEAGFYALQGMDLADSPYVYLPNLGEEAEELWDEDLVGSFVLTSLIVIGCVTLNEPIS